jgi:large subunit ribosomal protein L24
MKIKKGDTVTVITGKDKGKTGKVTLVLRAENKVIVEGMGIVKKHAKPTRRGEKGSIVEKSLPIHASNVRADK